MDEVTAQATSEIDAKSPEWPEKWVYQWWVCRGGVWMCFTSSQHESEAQANDAAKKAQRYYGGPVRLIRIPGSDAKGGK